ncbi:zinc-dependent peptidase [Puia sp.]|uniref:zinc-dependent peptidase n=1 Tax=Puia sp. TaxID=2045100 RepID=UPI002F40D5F5
MTVDAAYMTGFFLLGLLLVFLVYRLFIRVQTEKNNRVYEARHDDFDSLLSRYNPYYRSLSNTDRRRFLQRVLLFMEAKKFEYIDIEPDESMPLLISAAAVQLTFGLEHFRLDYFRTIHILKDKYRFGLYNMPFEGHVCEDGIYLSWTHFIREFTDYSDGQNVGLHEMAHALTYVNFTVHDGRDNSFHSRFTEFSAVARPIFERMQGGERTLLDPYAATNYQEFWAVCIETFFERPTSFKRQLPELYYSLCTLLNQDPLTPYKVLDSSIISAEDVGDGLGQTGS